MNGSDGAVQQRRAMVETQIASRGVRDDRVLQAMRIVPRERFVPPSVVEFAYEDTALPIEADQTISQPYIVSVMIEALRLEPGDRVLEVGTGSGYAAAVLSRLADRVFTIERHRTLAESADQVLRELGYDDISVLHGDGTLGWEEEAPFDAILVSAGGDAVPPGLWDQLAPGGRLVMPVGRAAGAQELVVSRKNADGTISERNLGAVRFVPLIGTVADEPEPRAATSAATVSGAPDVLDMMRRRVEPFDAAAPALPESTVDRMTGRRAVLLGEATHGTSEFYAVRADLTRRLIERGSVQFVAVEADWPDAAHLDRFVRGLERQPDELVPFDRFPRWMWANEETLAFLRWLRSFNEGIDDADDRVGFFGLDLYSLHTSIEAVVTYLEEVDPDTAALARRRFGCLTPWERDPVSYARLATTGQLEACTDDVVAVLQALLEQREAYVTRDGFKYLQGVQNARLVANAEEYYRVMFQGPSASWNLRDQHMFDTLVDLLTYHGPDAGAAVWAHNSHLGDASATDMGASGKHNVGQLCRERFGRACYAVGMGTHRGTVLAAHDWDEPGVVMDVRPSLRGSYERLSHDVETPAWTLALGDAGDERLRRALGAERLERAIGVVYRPETERASHYFHASLPRQFDEWVFVDQTKAVSPLAESEPQAAEEEGVFDTYPFAV